MSSSIYSKVQSREERVFPVSARFGKDRKLFILDFFILCRALCCMNIIVNWGIDAADTFLFNLNSGAASDNASVYVDIEEPRKRRIGLYTSGANKN